MPSIPLRRASSVLILAVCLGGCATEAPGPVVAEVPPEPVSHLASDDVRRPVLEMLPLWGAGSEAVDLEAETDRLRAWLAEHPEVADEPEAVSDHRAIASAELAWMPHVVNRRADDPTRWQTALSRLEGVPGVALFDDADWNLGSVPEGAPERMVEFLPVDLTAGRFTSADFDPQSLRIAKDELGRPVFHYAMREDRQPDYAAWTEGLTGRHVAHVLNGEVISAPVIMSRISGPGLISGDLDAGEMQDLLDACVR